MDVYRSFAYYLAWKPGLNQLTGVGEQMARRT
jgi:hypothetical protein